MLTLFSSACLCLRGSCTDEAYWRDRRDQSTLLDAAGHLYVLGGRLDSSAGSAQFNDVYRSSFSFFNLSNVGLACHLTIPRCGAGLSCWPDASGTVVNARGVNCPFLQTCTAPGSGGTPASQLSSSSLPAGVCDYGGQWPNSCQCKCGAGVEPYCTPCPGDGEQSGDGGSGMGAAGAIAVVVLAALLLVGAGVGLVWWKNRRGRVTYSLDALDDERAAAGSSSSAAALAGCLRWAAQAPLPAQWMGCWATTRAAATTGRTTGATEATAATRRAWASTRQRKARGQRRTLGQLSD